jgi:hypothetical protein
LFSQTADAGPEIMVSACLSGRLQTKKCPNDTHKLTKCVFFILRRLSQTEASIVLFYSPVHTVPEPFIHVYSQIVSASHIEIDEEALVDVVGNEFEQVHHFACQTESTVLGSDSDGSYVSVVLDAITLSFPEDLEPRKGTKKRLVWGHV